MQKTYSRWYWANEASREFLSRGYLQKGQTVESRVRGISDKAEEILRIEGFADKFYEYCSRGWFSFSTPVWTSFGKKGKLPISCYGSFVGDTLDSILNGGREIGMLSKYGGGTSMYLGEIRERGKSISTGGAADGPVHYSRIYDTIIATCKQGESRRGACAIYLPLEHPDIMEFLDIGTEGNPIQNLQYGVTVKDVWMRDMIAGNKGKRDIWAKVLRSRKNIGFPYIFFHDNVNKGIYKDIGEEILSSNLCSEINLPQTIKETFVCCLGSLNLLHYDEWKDTDLVETYTFFLDAVMSDFISSAGDLPGMGRALRFARRHRAIGLGVLGYHSLLQSKMIPVESMEAKYLNAEIFKNIRHKSDMATEKLADMFGRAPILQSTKYHRRNTTTLAIAPTKSSSFILGQVSMGIEPLQSNYFVKDLSKSQTVYKNPFLLTLLKSYRKNTTEVWDSIMHNDGSVQHLEFLTTKQKEVFKTAIEIAPIELIQQAGQRQQFIDQSQSLNLFIHPSISAKEINKLYIEAWNLGVKTLYYQYSQSAAVNFAREINSCIACEG